jgi:hypothetical protein
MAREVEASTSRSDAVAMVIVSCSGHTSCHRHGPSRSAQRSEASGPSAASITSATLTCSGGRARRWPPSRPNVDAAMPACTRSPRIWEANVRGMAISAEISRSFFGRPESYARARQMAAAAA